MNYRRYREEGGTVFLTVVTHSRRAILAGEGSRPLLREAFRQVRARRPFSVEAIVLLPEHLHLLMRLPNGDADYSVRIGAIKQTFTRAYLREGGRPSSVSWGQHHKRSRGVWQPRFWEDTIRNAKDFRMHVDYIHLNPVKHGLPARPIDWPWSSFRRWVKAGWYEPDWAGRVELPRQVEYIEP